MNTQTDTPDSTTAISRKRLWTARVLGGLPVAFLLFDSAVKLLRLPPAVTATVQLGYPPSVLIGLGLVELGCIIAYLVPATSVLGAVLLTGYLGGAIASHVRLGDPLLTHVLFPIYFATFIWGSLLIRGRLRAVLPFARAGAA
jgi:hypothetical protein